MILRLLTGAGLLPLALMTATAQAAAPAPGEISLHIETTATAVPDTAFVIIRITGQGPTREEARAALDAPRAEMNRALGELGVAEKDRIKLPETVEVSMVESVEAVAIIPDADCGARKCKSRKGQEPMVAPPRSVFDANEEWQITMHQPQGMARLSAIEGENLRVTPVEGAGTFYSDPAKARDEAVAKAFADAREEADRYARALGYKVVRIERVSNAKPALNMPDIIGTFAMLDKRAAREAFFQQGTMAVGVAIDFVIAPK
ncbi:SIMPL domain-containing protein [Novosphingobium sp. B 225]|uniref:SIMPL domain-containing protein n=1 Tax=Novosphingobium sp. B 225 TaxID=1961849 RepID=UPI00159619D7|nr:SIMPL domain-containing protein [Novosphingobium sp. B 225]